jgi:hypothetical protein
MKIAQKIQALDLGTATYGASPFADMSRESFRLIDIFANAVMHVCTCIERFKRFKFSIVFSLVQRGVNGGQ